MKLSVIKDSFLTKAVLPLTLPHFFYIAPSYQVLRIHPPTILTIASDVWEIIQQK